MDRSKMFEDIVSDTIKWETGGDKSGAFTDDPDDSGRATKWGISQAANPDVNIKALTYKEAVDIYYTKYWNQLYDLIPDAQLAFKVFDMGVLNGVKVSVKKLQKAIKKQGHIIKVDGLFGPLTLTALNLCYAEGQGNDLYQKYIELFQRRALYIVTIKPWNLKYFNGWRRRIEYTFVPAPVIEAKGTGQTVRGK